MGRQANLSSAVINFAKFREERLVHGVELTQEVDALAAKKQQAEDENERLVNELRAATAVREQEAPEEARLKAENEGLATTVQEAFNQQTAVHEDSLRLKQELEPIRPRVSPGRGGSAPRARGACIVPRKAQRCSTPGSEIGPRTQAHPLAARYCCPRTHQWSAAGSCCARRLVTRPQQGG